MLRQQMAEFHGEMPSAVKNKPCATAFAQRPHCQQTIRVRDNIPLLSWLMLVAGAAATVGENQQALSAAELLTAPLFLLASLVWPESGWGWR